MRGLLIIAFLALAGCATIEGIGQDISAGAPGGQQHALEACGFTRIRHALRSCNERCADLGGANEFAL